MSTFNQAATVSDLEPLIEMMRHMQQDDPWSEPFDDLRVRENVLELLANPRYG
jgi:hypothetical protein